MIPDDARGLALVAQKMDLLNTAKSLSHNVVKTERQRNHNFSEIQLKIHHNMRINYKHMLVTLDFDITDPPKTV